MTEQRYVYGQKVKLTRAVTTYVSPIGRTTMKKGTVASIEICDEDGITVCVDTGKTRLHFDVEPGDIEPA